MNEEIYEKLVAKLRTMTSLRSESAFINSDTEIYADLKIYGDDLFELLIWINDEFDVNVVVAGGKYAPSEMLFFKLFETVKKAFGGRIHRYKSLKVRDLVQAIDAGGGQFD